MDEYARLPLRARKRARTRALIERTALELFVERGFDATTVAEIAAACEIGERTFFAYFASKEEVALSDISSELNVLAALIAARRPGEGLLDVLRVAVRRRVALFRSREVQVAQRRAVEAAHVRVHARAVALREETEGRILAPEFARELGCAPDDARVALLTGAFSGVSSVLDRVIAEAVDDDAAERVVHYGFEVLAAALDALRPARALQPLASAGPANET